MTGVQIICGLVILSLAATAAPAPRLKPLPGEAVEVEVAKGVKMTFCWIPEGKATLGSPSSEKCRSVEETEREFTTKGFWMGKYPVTQAEWEAVMGNNPSGFSKGGRFKEQVAGVDTNRFPVDSVSWNDCQDFLKKANQKWKMPAAMRQGRLALPHEDQWEYACRGGKGNEQPFYFGKELNGTLANVDGSNPYGARTTGPFLDRTSEVGRYERAAPHPWRLCDMCGNVWQWCENIHEDWNEQRVLRGGSWYMPAAMARSAGRFRDLPDFRYFGNGFRVVVLP